ncbi:hypothetical protein ACPC54_34080 [Kitasatospora sp. NPDC094028]
MEPGDDRPARTAPRAAAAALGAVFFVLAVTVPARWAYGVGALLLGVSVLLGRRPRR